MSQPRYLWRRLTSKQRVSRVAEGARLPVAFTAASPQFRAPRFLISAACYEHRHYIGHSPERMGAFARDLLAVFASHASQAFAWCVLPNHYHALLEVPDSKRAA